MGLTEPSPMPLLFVCESSLLPYVLNRVSFMIAHVLLNLSNKLRKRDQM